MNDDFTRVASLDQVPNGEMIAVTLADGTEILLANVGGTVYALSDICSHADAWLDAGWLFPESLEVECPLHEGRFDLRTGGVNQEPPEEPIAAYQVRVEGDDILLGPVKT